MSSFSSARAGWLWTPEATRREAGCPDSDMIDGVDAGFSQPRLELGALTGWALIGMAAMRFVVMDRELVVVVVHKKEIAKSFFPRMVARGVCCFSFPLDFVG